MTHQIFQGGGMEEYLFTFGDWMYTVRMSGAKGVCNGHVGDFLSVSESICLDP